MRFVQNQEVCVFQVFVWLQQKPYLLVFMKMQKTFQTEMSQETYYYYANTEGLRLPYNYF